MKHEDERFRITPWPSIVETPQVVAVPRLAGVADYFLDDWPEEDKVLLDPGSAADRFVQIGPTATRPVSGEPIDDGEETDVLFIEPEVQAEHPGCEEYLITASSYLDAAPTLLVRLDPPRVVPLPDELFMREFLTVDLDDAGSILNFLTSWGLLIETFVIEASMQLVPRPWLDLDERPDPKDAETAFRSGGGEECFAFTRRYRDEKIDLAVAAAALDPLDACLDESWRSRTELRDELQRLHEGEATADEGDHRTFGRASQPESMVSVSLWGFGRQRLLIAIYQAVFETWLQLDLGVDLHPDALARPPRPELADPWASRGLPSPATGFEAVSTIQFIVNDATRVNGPRLELAHPAFDNAGVAYGRPVPSILNAMCLQLLTWIADGVPARRCANETCNQWFSRQRGRAVHGQYRAIGVMYCSASCAKSAAQRRYRRRRRAEG